MQKFCKFFLHNSISCCWTWFHERSYAFVAPLASGRGQHSPQFSSVPVALLQQGPPRPRQRQCHPGHLRLKGSTKLVWLNAVHQLPRCKSSKQCSTHSTRSELLRGSKYATVASNQQTGKTAALGNLVITDISHLSVIGFAPRKSRVTNCAFI